MKSSGTSKSLFKRLSLLSVFLIAALPTFFSLSVHIGALYLSNNVTWSFGKEESEKQPTPTSIVRKGKQDDRLKFQGEDPLDSFHSEDKMVYPKPEIEYKAVAPDVDFYPDAGVNEESDIISIEAATVENLWVNPSTGRQPLHTGPERFVGSFSQHIESLRQGGLDVVFVFDATASMESFLIDVKLKIENLTQAFKKLVPTCRIGLIAYRDRDDESVFVTRIHPLTYGTLSFPDFLADIDAKGGADREEAVYDALKAAALDMNWHKKSKKFILLIGDAPPHSEDMGHIMDLITAFRRDMGGTVAVLDTRGPEFQPAAHIETPDSIKAKKQVVMDEFKAIAQAGRGESARLTNDEKVVKKMLLLIFGEQWEMYLGEFMKNL